MSLRSNTVLLVGSLLFGLLALPWLVYATGAALLGPYAGGGAGAFFVDFLHDLLLFQWHAWALALGPLAIVAVWLGLWRATAYRN